MNIAVIGINHQTAPVALLECMALSEARKIEAMLKLLDPPEVGTSAISEVVILNTCGRFEVYFATPKKSMADGIIRVQNFFNQQTQGITQVLTQTENQTENQTETLLNRDAIGAYLYLKTGEDALEHMVQVAVGLDSIVLGEDQIIGQMKAAHHMAQELGCTQRILNVTFRDAIASAKKIKSALKISEIPLSLSYVGVKLMAEVMPLKGKRLLVVGLGEMGLLAIQHAHALGGKITVSNRSKDKIIAIQERYPDIEAVAYDSKAAAISQMDCVITATAAPHMVFTKADFMTVTHEMVVLDLSLPKDVDDQVAELPTIQLINLETLSKTVEQNQAQRQLLVDKAHVLVADHVAKMASWLERASVHTTLKDLGDLVTKSHTDAMSFVDEKLNLDRHQRAIVDKAMQAALKRIVRSPIQNLNSLETQEERDGATYWLQKLFTTHQEDD